MFRRINQSAGCIGGRCGDGELSKSLSTSSADMSPIDVQSCYPNYLLFCSHQTWNHKMHNRLNCQPKACDLPLQLDVSYSSNAFMTTIRYLPFISSFLVYPHHHHALPFCRILVIISFTFLFALSLTIAWVEAFDVHQRRFIDKWTDLICFMYIVCICFSCCCDFVIVVVVLLINMKWCCSLNM